MDNDPNKARKEQNMYIAIIIVVCIIICVYFSIYLFGLSSGLEEGSSNVSLYNSFDSVLTGTCIGLIIAFVKYRSRFMGDIRRTVT